MYTKEQYLKALEVYYETGSVTQTITILGYPLVVIMLIIPALIGMKNEICFIRYFSKALSSMVVTILRTVGQRSYS